MKSDTTRTLVLAPRGRDGELTGILLAKHDIEAEVCASGDAFLNAIAEGAGCAIVTEEALGTGLQRALAKQLSEQPPWSDFPLIVLAGVQAAHHLQLMSSALGNVTVIERPIAPQTLITATRAALRGRRRQYEGRAAIQQRDQFLAMLGHELRTPLGAIVLATELARSGTDRVQLDDRLALIARQSKLLARLVDDLLDVARVTTGKIVLRHETVDVDATIRGCIEALTEHARARAVSLVFGGGSGTTLEADQARLEQVINNLISNAIKYSQAGRTVRVTSSCADGECEIRVRDQGIGIAPEMQGRVFDLFAQVDGSLSRADGGLGIGLTLVDRIVRLHGGTVAVESAGLGQGSVFIVRLPIGTLGVSNVVPLDRARAADKLRVALVEDNEDLRVLTSDLLAALDCIVEVAVDGPDGVALILRQEPDLALIDIGLPELDGFGVARAVRDKLGRSTLLVAVTGFGRDQDREHAKEAGFDSFVTKPLSIDTLRDLLERARRARARTRNTG